jgi:hypothetical protein
MFFGARSQAFRCVAWAEAEYGLCRYPGFLKID